MTQSLERAAHANLDRDAVVSTEAVRDELQRILASGLFVNSQRPGQFLRFVVESTLAGKQEQIKEYLIGVEVFGRPATYDPKDDPIVRIEAGRLRKRLSEYYGGPGANDPFIIELPKGGYVPAFRAPSVPEGPDTVKSANAEFAPVIPIRNASRWRSRTVAVVLVTAAVALASIGYVLVRRRFSETPASIAVLPFLNLSGGPAGDYLSAGVAEELTTDLAQLNGLRVVAATSAFQFRGKSEDVRKIGQALNAEALMEGSISPSSGGLRIDAQLVDARNGYHLWSKAYDVQSTDLYTFEQDIVRESARVLRIPVSGAVPATKRDTESAEAHDLYLRGRYLWNTRQLPDMMESVQLFERAIKDDPNYALAYAGLADSYTVMAINTQMSPAEAVPRAQAALQHALALDSDLAQAHATLGLLQSQCEWNWHMAALEFRKAIELQPNYAPAHHWAALDHMELGEFAAADAEFRKAQVLDPLSPMISEGLAENFYDARRYDETISTVLNMPDPKVGWAVLANAYLLKGMYAEALKVPEVANATDLDGFLIRAEILIHSGDRAAGLKILDDLEHNRRNPGAEQDYIPPGYLAWAYAMAGDKERAFALLEKAYQQHDPSLANLKVDPGFDSLRSDPRYVDLLKRVGLSE
jgi:TolB-like protein/Flp pilus assembly protein TadD